MSPESPRQLPDARRSAPPPPGHCQALHYPVFWFPAPLWAGI
ncbi:TPA: gamma-glutamylcyclotransferase, partial [Klebsiella pneumoniae]|nr:gamma-glutamylcyclotransferase [Klebsiella pneumoniae]